MADNTTPTPPPAPVKIKEKIGPSGFSSVYWSRVRTLKDGEKMPDGAKKVPDDTAEYDWKAED